MKKLFISFVVLAFLVILGLYISFLVVLPKKIDLNTYKSDIQKIVNEQTNLTLNFDTPVFYTTPLLGVGFTANNVDVKLPDKSTVFAADSLKTTVSLPSLLLLTVKISCFELENPRANLNITNNKEFFAIKIIQERINEIKLKNAENQVATKDSFFNPAWVRVKIPAITLFNYDAKINDLKSKHFLKLSGEKALIYYNVDKIKVRTLANLYSDEQKNIVANLDINSILPPKQEDDPEDDPPYCVEVPFMNPVQLFRDYDLKANLDIKLKIRENGKLYGYLNVDNLTMNLSNYQLPMSYSHSKFSGTRVFTDSTLHITDKQDVKFLGKFNYGKRPSLDMNILSKELFFKDIVKLSKAFLDTLHIRNDLASLQSSGYLKIDTTVKTNFKHLKSNGNILIKNGALVNKNKGLSLNKINANICLDNNILNFADTSAFVHNKKISIDGKIDEKSDVNITVNADDIPLKGFYKAFAPRDLKSKYNMLSGNLFLDAKIVGKLKNPYTEAKLDISNFAMTEKSSNMIISNENLSLNIKSGQKAPVIGTINNKNFKVTLPKQKSTILDKELTILLKEEAVTVLPTKIFINTFSIINISGDIKNHLKDPLYNFVANGKFYAKDTKTLLGEQAAPFVNAKGIMPLKLLFSGDKTKQTLIAQILTDKNNFITPIDINELLNKQNIFQTKIYLKNNKINIRDTGIYTNQTEQPFTDDFAINILNADNVVAPPFAV